MQQSWTFKFPEVVRQHILGVLDNVMYFWSEIWQIFK